MANIIRVVILVAFVCAISALPAMNGQEEPNQLVDLLSVDDVPQQDAELAAVDAGQVRDKRTLFKIKKFFKYPVYYGHGGESAFLFSKPFRVIFEIFIRFWRLWLPQLRISFLSLWRILSKLWIQFLWKLQQLLR